MKKIIGCALSVFSAVCLLVSCDDFMDVHKDFVKDGEIIYAAKVDSVAVYGGKGRVKLGIWMYNATLIDKLVVSWNLGRDTLSLPVSFAPGRDSMEIVIDNLPEKAYTFELQTYDIYGNPSLKETGTGSSYGADFEENMNSRKVRSALLGENGGGVITWATADERLVATEVVYTDRNDERVTLRVLPTEMQTVCENVNAGVGFISRSLLLPEPTAIDTFYTAWSDPIAFPARLDRTGWAIISCSSAANGYAPEGMLDESTETFWHTNFSPPDPFPHVVVVDLQEVLHISAIELTRRLGFPAQQGTFRFEASEDNVSYEVLGELVFSDPDVLKFSLSAPARARYIRLSALDNKLEGDTSVSLSDFQVIGVRQSNP